MEDSPSFPKPVAGTVRKFACWVGSGASVHQRGVVRVALDGRRPQGPTTSNPFDEDAIHRDCSVNYPQAPGPSSGGAEPSSIVNPDPRPLLHHRRSAVWTSDVVGNCKPPFC